MFPFSKRTQENKSPSTSDQLFKRALALGAGLTLLWLALSVMPKPSNATQPITFSDQGGTVVSSEVATPTSSLPDLGKISAGLLLLGLIGFAMYWQKRSANTTQQFDVLQKLGKLQLSPNQHVHLIGCGKDVLLVGTSGSQMTALHQLPLDRLHATAPKESNKSEETINAPQYCAPSSTLRDNPDFGVLLQQFSLTSQSKLEAPTN